MADTSKLRAFYNKLSSDILKRRLQDPEPAGSFSKEDVAAVIRSILRSRGDLQESFDVKRVLAALHEAPQVTFLKKKDLKNKKLVNRLLKQGHSLQIKRK